MPGRKWKEGAPNERTQKGWKRAKNGAHPSKRASQRASERAGSGGRGCPPFPRHAWPGRGRGGRGRDGGASPRAAWEAGDAGWGRRRPREARAGRRVSLDQEGAAPPLPPRARPAAAPMTVSAPTPGAARGPLSSVARVRVSTASEAAAPARAAADQTVELTHCLLCEAGGRCGCLLKTVFGRGAPSAECRAMRGAENAGRGRANRAAPPHPRARGHRSPRPPPARGLSARPPPAPALLSLARTRSPSQARSRPRPRHRPGAPARCGAAARARPFAARGTGASQQFQFAGRKAPLRTHIFAPKTRGARAAFRSPSAKSKRPAKRAPGGLSRGRPANQKRASREAVRCASSRAGPPERLRASGRGGADGGGEGRYCGARRDI